MSMYCTVPILPALRTEGFCRLFSFDTFLNTKSQLQGSIEHLQYFLRSRHTSSKAARTVVTVTRTVQYMPTNWQDARFEDAIILS